MNRVLLTAFAVFSMMGATSVMTSSVVYAEEATEAQKQVHQNITDAAYTAGDAAKKAGKSTLEIARAINKAIFESVKGLGLSNNAALSLRASYTASTMVKLGVEATIAVDAAIVALETTVSNLAVQATTGFLAPNGMATFLAVTKGAALASTGAAGAAGGLYFGSYVYVVGGAIALGVASISSSSTSSNSAALKSRAG